MRKQTIVCIAIILAVLAEMAFIGINGLTLVSIPITIFLGLEIIERITESETI